MIRQKGGLWGFRYNELRSCTVLNTPYWGVGDEKMLRIPESAQMQRGLRLMPKAGA